MENYSQLEKTRNRKEISKLIRNTNLIEDHKDNYHKLVKVGKRKDIVEVLRHNENKTSKEK
jgi:hypothetical protein